MHKLRKALAVSGLAICAGPLSLEAMAQGYIDLESERAATNRSSTSTSSQTETSSAPAATAPATSSPYSAPDTTTTSPAKSYGLNSQAAPATTLSAPPTAGGSQVGGEQNLGNLFYQLQQMQQEVMTLNGKVEEQAHELRRLREQNLERYVDIDRRLTELGGNGASAAGGSTTTGSASIGGSAIAGSSSAAEQPGEGDAYRSAYALVRGQQFNEAINAFKAFLGQYPTGKYAPNAHYWLGELYLVVTPQDLESSRQAFMLLLEEYPDNSKVPDALYKLGKVQYLKGNRDRAKEFFDRVISEYGSSNSSAVNLAREFLRENY